VIPGARHGERVRAERHIDRERGSATTPHPGGANMGSKGVAPQLVSALSDGTGLTEEEIKLLIAAAALVTALVAFLRAYVALTDVLPIPGTRAEDKGSAATRH
jgi:hypothetical protein